jgi:hypothetical protein
MNDPAYDMPFDDYQQVGSFKAPVTPPALGPFDGTLVALPCINPDWLRLVLGAVDQLRNPSSWAVLSPSQTVTVLGQVEDLRSALSVAGACEMCPLLRLNGCVLQISCDAGATWTDADNWAASFYGCVQAAVPIIGPPPNPGGITTDQMACAQASFLTTEVIQISVQKAIDNVLLNQNLLQYALDVSLVLPGFEWTSLFIEAVGVIYSFINSTTVSDYEAAMSSASLWSSVKCAIYSAIAADGHVDSSNFPAILMNISSIVYVHANVITAIHDYANALGWRGLANLAQPAGLDPSISCTDCGGSPTWCYQWDFNVAPGPFTVYGAGVYDAGIGWRSQSISTYEQIGLILPFGFSQYVTALNCKFTSTAGPAGPGRSWYGYLGGVQVGSQAIDTGTYPTYHESAWSPINMNLDQFVIRIPTTGGNTIRLQSILIQGTGVNPFGFNNCHGY